MRLRFFNLIEEIQASYWFIPTLMTAFAELLSFVTLTFDRRFETSALSSMPFIYLSQPAGARSFLGTVASSLLGVAGVSFSILMVVLPMTSGQFGPRLLGNFMRDRGNQVVLGTFISTFLYCLLVLRTVRGEGSLVDAAAFVPQLSLAVALLLTLWSLGTFIYFIHHTAESIQVANLLARVTGALRRHIDEHYAEEIFPAVLGRSPEAAEAAPALPLDFAEFRRSLTARRGNYVRAIDEAKLMRVAEREDLLIDLRVRPGDFVLEGETLAEVYPGIKLEPLKNELYGAFIFGPSRNDAQDLPFLFEQIMEVALRALSPGVNDPITALRCCDRLADQLALFARRDQPSPYRYGSSGELRVIAPTLSPADLVPHLFGPIRSYAKSDYLVLSHLLFSFGRMAALVESEAFRQAIATEARRVVESARAGLSESDFARLCEVHQALAAQLAA